MERIFILLSVVLCTITCMGQDFSRAEYFIDTDPGAGNGTPISLASTASPLTFTTTIPTASLSQGFHFLGVRIKESAAPWTIFESRGFYISSTTANSPAITAAEYFLDTDPGAGNATTIPVTAGDATNFTIVVPAGSLTSGFHFLAIRTKGADGKWGVFESRGFYISTSTTNVPNIVAAEYFFDNDPGTGNATPIPITAGATVNFTASLPATGLSKGFHYLMIRTKGSDDKWGVFEGRGFYVSSPNVVSNIVAAEYFIDTDPGVGSALPLTINPVASDISQTFTIPVPGALSVGDHFLFIRAQDSEGFWSEIERDTFKILNCTPPPSPAASNNSRCGAGSVTLTASGASGTQVYHWYEDATTPVVTATSAVITTPVLTTDKTYYVSIYDPGTTCESSRVAVTAIVTILPVPELNVSGSITFCESNSILLTAPVGFDKYLWSDGRTTQLIAATTTGNYFVKIGDLNGCFSVNSDTLTVNAIPLPAKPAIQVTGNTILCGIETTQLSAPAGFQYLWSTGETTQDISVSSAGNYSLSVRDGNGCQSPTSDPVVITTATDEAIITASGNILIATAGGSYQWFLNGEEIPGATGQALEINLFEFGVYAVEVTTGNCFSRSEDYTYLITETKNDEQNIFTVAPNPVHDILTIQNGLQRNIAITVVDAVGKKVMSKNVSEGAHEYNIAFLDAGVYYVIAETPLQSKVIKLNKL